MVSVPVVFPVAEGSVGSLAGVRRRTLPEGLGGVSVLTAVMVTTRRLVSVRAAAVPAALVLREAVLQPVVV